MKFREIYNVGENAGPDDLLIEGYGGRILQIKKMGPFYWMRARASKEQVKFTFGDTVLSSKWVFFFVQDLLDSKPLYLNGFDFGKSILYPYLKNKTAQNCPGIHTDRLFRYAQKHTICNGVFLNTPLSRVTVIMGPSGCGKSVFLKMLAGYDFPDVGKITVLGKSGRKSADLLGFVPQGHAMLSDLTTEQALNFRLSMRFPFLNRKERYKVICRACRLLGIDYEDRIETTEDGVPQLCQATTHKKIGQMEWVGNYPSGGQRRRINIAHELVLQPRVLVLDEPTSGLSSKDSDDLMASLVNLAHTNEMSIVMTLHQPSINMFRSFDDLLLLSYGGKVCYYGPAKNACSCPFINISSNGRNDAELLLAAVSDPSLAESISSDYEEYIRADERASDDDPYLPVARDDSFQTVK